MDTLFDQCVALLQDESYLPGLTCKEINVWVFVIIHPLITQALLGSTLYYDYGHKKTKEKPCLLVF